MMARWKEANSILDKRPRCSFCGTRSADAVWVGKRTIGVCLQCAVSDLPGLIADAIAERLNPQRDDVQDVVDRRWQIIRANFYEAMHRNDSRLLSEWQKSHAGGLS